MMLSSSWEQAAKAQVPFSTSSILGMSLPAAPLPLVALLEAASLAASLEAASLAASPCGSSFVRRGMFYF
jgi:hypothetical protein